VRPEPGYYEDGKFGIRIENVMVVADAATPHRFDGMQFLCLENLTLVRPACMSARPHAASVQVPYDAALIDAALLTAAERAYVDAYHAECWRCDARCLSVGCGSPACVWRPQCCVAAGARTGTRVAP
jgi:Xaa-Pro aminopeptidase